eukprot:5711665-Pleurochrysis_carterae.AAC.1
MQIAELDVNAAMSAPVTHHSVEYVVTVQTGRFSTYVQVRASHGGAAAGVWPRGDRGVGMH